MAGSKQGKLALGSLNKQSLTNYRLWLGLALVALSVFGVFLVVQANNQSQLVYVSQRDMVPGEQVKLEELVLREVNLSSLSNQYFTSADQLPETFVLKHPVTAGNILPKSAVGTVLPDSTLLVVPLVTELPQRLIPGDLVDLWSLGAEPNDGFVEISNQLSESINPPRLVIQSAVVTAIPQENGIVSAGGGRAKVELLIPQRELPKVLALLHASEALTVVPSA